jgi:hypothetical protein
MGMVFKMIEMEMEVTAFRHHWMLKCLQYCCALCIVSYVCVLGQNEQTNDIRVQKFWTFATMLNYGVSK